MEKTTRAALKSEFDRAVMSKSNNHSAECKVGTEKGSGSTLVILDSLNYIKGYRYELYCISKAAGERHGVVWIMGSDSDGECTRIDMSSPSDELAKKRNQERKELQMKHEDEPLEKTIDLDGYFENDESMDALVLRFEPPDEKNRWENPLYKVDVTGVLPWGKDGTLEVSSAESDSFSKLKKDSDGIIGALSSQMKAVQAKDPSPGDSNIPSAKSSKKSASGFKRRAKKSTQPKASAAMQKPQAAPSADGIASTTAINAPSSMASRNLNSAADSGNSLKQDGGSKRKMEDVIDSILDSFLLNIAPLQEGLSTLKQVSAESNVLNQVDNLTQRTNNEILKAQKMVTSLSAGVGGRIFISLNGGSGRRAMNLSKPLYGNELRNCRRQFLKWIAGHPMQDGTREEDMVEVYISYIESNI